MENSNPYPGPRPFTPEESHIFFGREDVTAQLLQKLFDVRFVSIVGMSGCGKTSLVQAGLISTLMRGSMSENWRIARMRPGNTPFRSLAKALLADAALRKEAQAGENEVFAFLRQNPHSLVQAFRESALSSTKFLLIVDQLEDIFWQGNQEIQDEIFAFVELLVASVSEHDVPIHIVTTVRSEFVGECALFQGLPELMNSGQFLVPHLNRDQQTEVIVEPAKVYDGNVEPRLVNRLLEDMQPGPDQLPVLQHCLMRMWLRVKSQVISAEKMLDFLESDVSATAMITMTLEDYEAVGGLRNAFFNHANEIFHSLDHKQQKIAEHLFRYLNIRQYPEQRTISTPVRLWDISSTSHVSATEMMQIADLFRHPDSGFLMPFTELPLKPDSIVNVRYESLFREWQSRLEKRREPQPPKKSGRHREFILLLCLVVMGLVAALAVSKWFTTKQQLEQSLSRTTGTQLTQQTGVEEAFHLGQVDIRDIDGAIVPPVPEVYYIESGEELRIEIAIDDSSAHYITITYLAERGSVEPDTSSIGATYIAPDTSGIDSMKIEALHKETGNVLDGVMLKFKVY